MFDEYKAAGSSSSVNGMRSHIRFRRDNGYWDPDGSRLVRAVQQDIEALIEEEATRRVAVIVRKRDRTEARLRQRMWELTGEPLQPH
jgi:hypothetical protein